MLVRLAAWFGTLATGLGLVLAVVAGALSPEWSGSAVVVGALAMVFGGAGLASEVVVPLWRRGHPSVAQRDRTLAVELAALLTEGNELLRAVPLDDSDKEAMDASYRAGSDWATRIRDRLDTDHPGWTALFLDDSFGPQYFATNVPRHSTITNWYERRLTRLRDLLARL